MSFIPNARPCQRGVMCLVQCPECIDSEEHLPMTSPHAEPLSAEELDDMQEYADTYTGQAEDWTGRLLATIAARDAENERQRQVAVCCVTGLIAGDSDACGDCDPCILGSAKVPEVVKRLLHEKEQWRDKYATAIANFDALASAAQEAEKALEKWDIVFKVFSYIWGEDAYECPTCLQPRETGHKADCQVVDAQNASVEALASLRAALRKARAADGEVG